MDTLGSYITNECFSNEVTGVGQEQLHRKSHSIRTPEKAVVTVYLQCSA